MEPLAETLWTLEKKHWFDGAAFYERQLEGGGELVIPFPADLQDRDAALQGLRPARQFGAIELQEKTMTEQGDTVLLSYSVVAWRDCCSTPLRARCASTYLDDDGTWLRLSHERDTSVATEESGEMRKLLRRQLRPMARLGAA